MIKRTIFSLENCIHALKQKGIPKESGMSFYYTQKGDQL